MAALLDDNFITSHIFIQCTEYRLYINFSKEYSMMKRRHINGFNSKGTHTLDQNCSEWKPLVTHHMLMIDTWAYLQKYFLNKLISYFDLAYPPITGQSSLCVTCSLSCPSMIMFCITPWHVLNLLSARYVSLTQVSEIKLIYIPYCIIIINAINSLIFTYFL